LRDRVSLLQSPAFDYRSDCCFSTASTEGSGVDNLAMAAASVSPICTDTSAALKTAFIRDRRCTTNIPSSLMSPWIIFVVAHVLPQTEQPIIANKT
ncbi:MAG: hypothetical protein WBY01_20290, partial [Pseudolabrys sp.]